MLIYNYFMTNRSLKRKHIYNIIQKVMLVLVSISLIVVFLPRNKTQQIKYEAGKPWIYGSMIARFDFPVYKTDETIKKEQDSLLAFFMPYYSRDNSVAKVNLLHFSQKYGNGIPGLPLSDVKEIEKMLSEMYDVGIMPTQEYNEINKDTTSAIRLIIDREARVIPLSGCYSVMSAYQRLIDNEANQNLKLALQRANLNEFITPNLIYEKEKSEAERNDILSSVPVASNIVLSGQKIIDRGDIVDDYTARVLNSLEKEIERRSSTSKEITNNLIGQALYVAIIIICFTLYLQLFRKDYFSKPRSIAMLYSLLTIYPIIVSLMIRNSFFSVYIIPFAMVPIIVRVFMDSRTAFTTHFAMVLLCAIAVRYQYEFIIVQLVSGLAGIYALREMSQRVQFLKAALWVLVASCGIFFAIQLTQSNDTLSIDIEPYYYFIVNAVLLLLAFPLMYVFEKTFGFVSDITLFELSDTNKSLIRQMSEIAPGTFQHSITVANLASEIANKIGANSLLLRTGALYHDIGKMNNPVFFTENQAGYNPHNNLPYKESARIIIGHVTEGVKMAEKYNLPRFIIDFILTHHGRGITKYFYIQYKNEHPDEEVDVTPFQYPGPNPWTREQAILMMTDTCEAASRSLKEYTEENISNLVNSLIDDQVASGFFTNCPITFRDISTAKQILIEQLKTIYHTRVSYPKLKV